MEILFKFFHTICFDHILPFSQFFTGPPYLAMHQLHDLSLSQWIKQKTKPKTIRQNNTKTQVIQKTQSPFLLVNSSWAWAYLGVWLIYVVTFYWRKLIFFFPAGFNCKEPLGYGWDICLHPLFRTWILSGVNVWRSCMCCHSLCKSIRASVLLCL